MMLPMFPYDPQLAAATRTSPQSIDDVLQLLHTVDKTCIDGDGLKWFNWLYLQVTETVHNLVKGGFNDPAWLAELDVQFATLYAAALNGYLSDGSCPKSWAVMLSARNNTLIARIQFALAGINAHINHDLPAAIVATCRIRNTSPQHGSPQYNDYTSLNGSLDGLIQRAKQEMHVRLLGDPLPAVSHLENTVAAWGTAAAREQAWRNAEALWELRPLPSVAKGILDSLDGLVTVGNKIMLVPVP